MATDFTDPLRHQVPEGVKDRLPREAYRLRGLSAELAENFRRWGYREVITPIFEFLETVLIGQGSLGRREDYYQLFDRRGRTLALRPDMTAPIARLAATKLAAEQLPLRLSYWGPVFRHRERKSGALHEIWQAGVELIGAGGARADAEMIALACAALQAAGLEGFQVGVGHVDFIEGVLAEAGVDGAPAAALKEALVARDLVDFEKTAWDAAPAGAELLQELANFHGGYDEALATFGALPNPRVQKALAEIGQTLELLAAYGVSGQVALDLGLARSLGYYTGVVFEGYAPGVGAPVLGGGRYDRLLADFDGADSFPATGFALDTERVLQALERQGKLAQEPALDAVLAPLPGSEARAMVRAREMRAAGMAVEVELQGLTGADLAAYARARGARQVIVVEPGGAAPQPDPPEGAGSAGPGRAKTASRSRVARLRQAGVSPIH